MLNIGDFAIPPLLVAFCGLLGILASITIYVRGHNFLMIPIAFSIGWITLGYFFYGVGAFDIDDLGAIVRSGFVVLCMDLVAGGIIYWRGWHR